MPAAAMVRTAFRPGKDDLLQLQVGLDDHDGIAAILDLGSQVTVLNTGGSSMPFRLRARGAHRASPSPHGPGLPLVPLHNRRY